MIGIDVLLENRTTVYDVIYRIDGCTHTLGRFDCYADARDYIETRGRRIMTSKGSRKLDIIKREW